MMLRTSIPGQLTHRPGRPVPPSRRRATHVTITSELTLLSLARLTASTDMHDIPSAVSEQASVGNSKMKGHYVRTLRTSPTRPTSAPPALDAHDTAGTAASWPRSRYVLCSTGLVRGCLSPSPYTLRLDRCRARMLRHSLKGLPRAPNALPPVRPGPTSPLAMPQRSPDSIVDRDEGIQCRTET
ncbi:hypothetical protein EDB83DRAFT_1784790 [Lactarius deliciosus]|nr:hypothetical protein EDB83DRAFT_1784790 [Lactarius deliciosus]